jgi:hypothetical protein
VSLSPGASLSPGVINSVSLSATKSITNCSTYSVHSYFSFYCPATVGACSSSFTGRSGNLTIVRQGNV